jgi:hypothetical protein
MRDFASELLRIPTRRSSHHPEILRKPAGSKSQPLATFSRPVCFDVGPLSGLAGPKGDRRPRLGAQNPAACYGELPRIRLPRTRVNKGKKKEGQGVLGPGPRLLLP